MSTSLNIAYVILYELPVHGGHVWFPTWLTMGFDIIHTSPTVRWIYAIQYTPCELCCCFVYKLRYTLFRFFFVFMSVTTILFPPSPYIMQYLVQSNRVPRCQTYGCLILEICYTLFLLYVILYCSLPVNGGKTLNFVGIQVDPFCEPWLFNPWGQISLGQAMIVIGCVIGSSGYGTGDSTTSWFIVYATVWAGIIVCICTRPISLYLFDNNIRYYSLCFVHFVWLRLIAAPVAREAPDLRWSCDQTVGVQHDWGPATSSISHNGDASCAHRGYSVFLDRAIEKLSSIPSWIELCVDKFELSFNKLCLASSMRAKHSLSKDNLKLDKECSGQPDTAIRICVYIGDEDNSDGALWRNVNRIVIYEVRSEWRAILFNV